MKKLTLVFLSIIFVLPLCAAQEKPMNNKEITIKAAKIAGYTIGFMLPTYWLLHEYNEGKMYNNPFIEKLYKPLQELYSDPKTRRDNLSITSAHGAILGCLGYSTYGLYTELEPSMKTVLSFLKDKIRSCTKK